MELSKDRGGISSRFSSIYTLCFILVLITVRVFDEDPKLYYVPKYLMLLFFALMIFHSIRYGLQLGKSFLLPTIFFLLEVLSWIWSYNRSVAGSQLWTQVQLYILFFFVYSLARDCDLTEVFYKGIYISGFVMILWILTKVGLRSYFSQMQNAVRMGGDFGNENTFGLLFASSVLVAFFYFLSTKKIVHLLSVFAFIFFSFSSGSKKALVLIVIGLFIIMFAFFGLRKAGKILIYTVLAGLLLLFLLRLPIFSVVNDRMMAYLNGDFDYSNYNRAMMISNGFELFKNSPIWGYGLNNFSCIAGGGTYSHNNYIELLVSLGLLGTIAYYVMFLKPSIIYARLALFGNKRYIIIFLLAVVEIGFGYGMVQFYSKSTWILLGLLLGSLDNQEMIKLE